MHRYMLAICLLTTLTTARAAAQSADRDQASVLAAVQSFHAVLSSGDRSVAERLLADDVVIQEGGGVETRAQYLADHLPADVEFEKSVTVKRSPIRVIVQGDVAWATSTSDMQGTFQKRAIDLMATEVMILSRVPDGWRIRAISWTSRARRPPQ